MRTAAFVSVMLVAVMPSACGGKQVATPDAPGGTLVALLPDAGAGATGASGSVTVSNGAGSQELIAAFDATRVVGNGPPSALTKIDEAEVQSTFGDVLADLPPEPERFNLYFENDSAELTRESKALLPSVFRAVANRVAPDVGVIGHTDTTGSTASNLRLGLNRAVTVRRLLISTGLDPSLVEVESHGESDLLTKTPDNTAEPRNRRVEITVK